LTATELPTGKGVEADRRAVFAKTFLCHAKGRHGAVGPAHLDRSFALAAATTPTVIPRRSRS
jgi:hypothetical protein